MRSKFFYDSLFGILLLPILYHYRKNAITSFTGAVFVAIGWIFNLLGTVGAYEIYFFGVGWDKFIHLINAFGLSFLAFNYFHNIKKTDGKSYFSIASCIIITLLVAEGVGAINEIAEFLGTTYFSIGQGLLGMSNGLGMQNGIFDKFDTHWDMVANTLGFLLWLIYLAISFAVKKSIFKTDNKSIHLSHSSTKIIKS